MKNMKWKQITITMFGALALLFLGAYIMDRVFAGVIRPLLTLITTYLEYASFHGAVGLEDVWNAALIQVVGRYDADFMQNYYAGISSLNTSVILFRQCKEIGVLMGEMLLAVPCLLIPVAAWLKSKKWSGLIASLGFAAASLAMGIMALSCGWDLLQVFNSVWSLLSADMLDGLLFITAAVGFFLLALSGLFGYRPALLFPLGGVLILPAVGALLGELPVDAMREYFVANIYSVMIGLPVDLSYEQLLTCIGISVSSFWRCALAGGTVLSLTTVIGLLPSLDAKPLIGKKRS